MWVFNEEILPWLDPAGNARLAIGRKVDARRKQQQIGARPENRTRRSGAGHLAAHGTVESLDAPRFQEVGLSSIALDARHRVVVRSQPAIVEFDQLLEEPPAVRDSRTGQLFPTGPRPSTARHDRCAVADLEHRSEKVNHRSVALESIHRHAVTQGYGSRPVQVGHRYVQPREAGIVDECIDEALVTPAGRAEPVLLPEEQRQASRPERRAERLPAPEREFQVGKREGRIDREEGARGIHGLEHGPGPAFAAQSVADDLEQLGCLGGFTLGYLDAVVRAGERREFAGLSQVLLQEL